MWVTVLYYACAVLEYGRENTVPIWGYPLFELLWIKAIQEADTSPECSLYFTFLPGLPVNLQEQLLKCLLRQNAKQIFTSHYYNKCICLSFFPSSLYIYEVGLRSFRLSAIFSALIFWNCTDQSSPQLHERINVKHWLTYIRWLCMQLVCVWKLPHVLSEHTFKNHF